MLKFSKQFKFCLKTLLFLLFPLDYSLVCVLWVNVQGLPVKQALTPLRTHFFGSNGRHSDEDNLYSNTGIGSEWGTGSGAGGSNRSEVVATARGVFSDKGGILENPETGVSIVIPPGALPPDSEQEIYFKVCRDSGGSLLPPLDKERG